MTTYNWRPFPAAEGFVPYLLLANLIIPLSFLFREPVQRLLPGLALLALFVILYRQLYWTVRWVPLLLALQVLITLILAAVYHPMYSFISFLFINQLSQQKTAFIVSIASVFTLGMAACAAPYIGTVGWELSIGLLPPLFGVFSMLPFTIRIYAQYKQMEERLQAATAQVERMAQQEERQRIARELHDTLGHTLSLIALKAEVVEKIVPRDPQKASQEAHDIRQTARSALKQMRELVTEMKVVRLIEEFGHARTLCAAAGIEISLPERLSEWDGRVDPAMAEARSIADGPLPLTALQETILAMCFREVLTNVVRHSRAASCHVDFEVEEGCVRLVVKDDGIGLTAEQTLKAKSRGLAGLRQRLALVDGSLELDSHPGAGTELTLYMPCVIRNVESR
ncbi:sensor histidine kinase [Paenibacillus sp. MER TA 81-3]|uniref:sensor histidine kinase n=1 Tax=Paenibacillus sp. MER TA 81-3 TaxID=2939573 RepID=UPI00203AFE1B|nr:sensor histidine kinase [Paenibacillus sp. MER TA 81-3]MCM3340305.1 sensor histidine kinase [Paenibacillus sp. MER TA 81-3]